MKRAVISTLLASGMLLGFGIYGARSDHGDDKSRPVTQAEGVTDADAPPIPGEPVLATPSSFTVPAVSPARPGLSCPSGWRVFDNPVAFYALCYPPGWGFTELRDPAPLAELRSVTLGGLHLHSPEAFPRQPGESLFDSVRARDATAIELNVVPASLPSDASNPTCIPGPRVVGGVSFSACEDTFDEAGLTRITDGPFHVLRIRLPLLRTPGRTQPYPEGPSVLMVVVRSSTDTYRKEAGLIWQLVRTIAAY